MIWQIRFHRAHDTKLICVTSRFREQLTHRKSRFALSIEPKRRRKTGQCLPLGGQIGSGQRLARVALKQRLGIKGVQMTAATIEKKVNDRFGLAGKLRRPGRKVLDRVRLGGLKRPRRQNHIGLPIK